MTRDRLRQMMAQWIFRRIWNLKKLASWVDPYSTVATLAIGYDGKKVRFSYHRPYISASSDDLGMSVSDWHKTSIKINNMIENNEIGRVL